MPCPLVVSGIATHFVPSDAVNKLVDDLVVRDGEGTHPISGLLAPVYIPSTNRFDPGVWFG